MKKLFLFFAVAAVTMTIGCDPSISYYYKIKNDTPTEINVSIGGKVPVIISCGDTKLIFTEGKIGTGIKDPLGHMASRKLTILINDELMSDNFWRHEYWEEESQEDEHHFTYTMTLTDELFQSFISEK